MDIFLLIVSIALFVVAVLFFFASEDGFQKNKSGEGWVALLMGIILLGGGLAIFFLISYDYGKGRFAADVKSGEMTVNEPYKTVHAIQTNRGNYALFICKMYDDAREGKTLKAGAEVTEVVLHLTDCDDPDNWTAYLLGEKTPPIFIKQKIGGYRSITEAEAAFLKKSLY
ncbi:MAG: hypothetical protein HYS73_01470 [Parcubacteria group bacterium]|nr:hypothetical protein [Parcubacteria group bacterium]MBI2049136.1 hypothetical protein [Parcubacteria group bacterium]